MTTLNHPLPRSSANETSNERDEEKYILRYIKNGSLCEYTYPPLLENGRQTKRDWGVTISHG